MYPFKKEKKRKEYKVYNILSDIGACLYKIVKVRFDVRVDRKF